MSELIPLSIFKAGKKALDSGDDSHPQWALIANEQHQMQVQVIQPRWDELQKALSDPEEKFHFILDDDGVLSWDEKAAETLELYYQSLDPNGVAWLRIPKTIWIMQKTNRRILLSDYLLAKFPHLFRTLSAADHVAPLSEELSAPKEILEMRKNRATLQLRLGVKLRSSAHSLKQDVQRTKPILEYAEE